MACHECVSLLPYLSDDEKRRTRLREGRTPPNRIIGDTAFSPLYQTWAVLVLSRFTSKTKGHSKFRHKYKNISTFRLLAIRVVCVWWHLFRWMDGGVPLFFCLCLWSFKPSVQWNMKQRQWALYACYGFIPRCRNRTNQAPLFYIP